MAATNYQPDDMLWHLLIKHDDDDDGTLGKSTTGVALHWGVGSLVGWLVGWFVVSSLVTEAEYSQFSTLISFPISLLGLNECPSTLCGFKQKGRKGLYLGQSLHLVLS